MRLMILFILCILIGSLACGCISEEEDELSKKPLFEEPELEYCAYKVIKEQDGVMDVHIEKNGRKVEIAIMMEPAYRNMNYLKEVGADAIRAVMTHSTDSHKPGYPIGISDYDYVVAIGISGNDMNPVLVGTKDHDSEYVVWSDGTYTK
jgi:hypothetical protein